MLYEKGNDFNKPFKLNFSRDTIVDTLRRTKNELKEEIGLEFIHKGQLVAAFTNVEKHNKFKELFNFQITPWLCTTTWMNSDTWPGLHCTLERPEYTTETCRAKQLVELGTKTG